MKGLVLVSIGWQSTREEVEKFLKEIARILNDEDKLYIVGRDKTNSFRAKYNLLRVDVKQIILSLDETNYSYTDNDRELAHGGQVWIFGASFPPGLVQGTFQIYIKLKIQGEVICLSLHEAEFDLKYPYLNY